MPALALDIGSHNIKAISGNPGKKPGLAKVVSKPNPLGIAFPNDDSEAEKLLNHLNSFINDNRLPVTDVRLSIPEDVVATKIISLPQLSSAELASAIDWQAEQHIPIKKDNLSLEYQVLHRPPKNVSDEPMKVLLVGVKQDALKRFTDIFLSLGIQPKILETQMLSILRSLEVEPQDPATLIIDIGASHTQMAIVDQGELKLVINHQSGGNLLTKTLQQNVENLDETQAEEYKHHYGLLENQLQGKIRQALLPAINSIAKEIQKTVRFYNSQDAENNISRIVLSGGTSRLPGLVEHLAQNIGTEVLLISPFAATQTEMSGGLNQQTMSVCMGLIMRKE